MSRRRSKKRAKGLLRRSSARHFLRHGWQTGLAVLGVGLGVTVVLGVDLAVSSARHAFTLSAEAVAGAATHRAVPGPSGLPDRSYLRLRRLAGVEAAAPVVDGHVVAPDGVVLRLLGVDPFAEADFRRYGGQGEAAAGVLIGTRAGLLSRSTAADLGVEAGDWLTFDVGGRLDSVRVAALLDPPDQVARVGLESLVLADIGTVQSLLGRDGLDRIDLVLSGPGDVVADRIQAILPPDATLQPAGTAAAGFERMTRSFDLNLRAMSLLALIFGLFLIYNSVTFSVVQRRRLLATLRALGATRRQLFAIIQGESLLLGLAGAALGLVLGTVLGQGLVRLVTRTIQDLYFVMAVRDLMVTPTAVVKALALGVLGTMAVAVPAAAEAAGTHPRSAMLRSTLEQGLRRRLPLISAAGLALGGVGGLVLTVSPSVDGSFVGLFGVILGLALLTPGTTLLLMRLLKGPVGRAFGVVGRMAAGGVVSGLSRTAPAIAALTIAVAATLGVTLMISSFRSSLIEWLDRTLAADLYVSPARPGGTASPPAALDSAALATIASDPAVAEVRRYWRGTVPAEGGPVGVMAVDRDSRLSDQFEILEGSAGWDDFDAGRNVLVSEPFAFRRDIDPGDALTLRTGAGPLSIPVTGVFRDYGSDQGMVMMAYETYRSLWGDSTVTAVALNLVPGSEPAAVRDGLVEATRGGQALAIRSNRGLARASLEVFDRTFAITEVLRLLTLIVAFVGVVSALMALQLERGRELGVLRANGMTPGQLGGMVASQTGLMGLAAGLMALPMGVLLAALMIEFVNRRSFGWTMDMAVDPGALLQGLVVAVAAALLAGLYPSWKMARTSPAEALRGE
jgi:putative ABC transport system permease protein